MSDSNDIDLEELKDQTNQGSRLDEAEREQSQQDLVEQLTQELEAIDQGNRQKTVSVWDGRIAALVEVLENNDDHRQRVGEKLANRLGQNFEDADRSDILRMALLLGFQEAAPEEMEALREAIKQRAVSQL